MAYVKFKIGDRALPTKDAYETSYGDKFREIVKRDGCLTVESLNERDGNVLFRGMGTTLSSDGRWWERLPAYCLPDELFEL